MNELNEREQQHADTLRELFGEVIYAYTRRDAIEDGTLVDLTEWASAREIRGGYFPRQMNLDLWGQEDTPVCVTRALWQMIDIEQQCAECDGTGKVTITAEPIVCQYCAGKGKTKGAGVWQDTRGRAHDVISMSMIAAVAFLRRKNELPHNLPFALHLSKDGRSNGPLIELRISVDGDGVTIMLPSES